jgi:hypothetical protein
MKEDKGKGKELDDWEHPTYRAPSLASSITVSGKLSQRRGFHARPDLLSTSSRKQPTPLLFLRRCLELVT